MTPEISGESVSETLAFLESLAVAARPPTNAVDPIAATGNRFDTGSDCVGKTEPAPVLFSAGCCDATGWGAGCGSAVDGLETAVTCGCANAIAGFTGCGNEGGGLTWTTALAVGGFIWAGV